MILLLWMKFVFLYRWIVVLYFWLVSKKSFFMNRVCVCFKILFKRKVFVCWFWVNDLMFILVSLKVEFLMGISVYVLMILRLGVEMNRMVFFLFRIILWGFLRICRFLFFNVNIFLIYFCVIVLNFLESLFVYLIILSLEFCILDLWMFFICVLSVCILIVFFNFVMWDKRFVLGFEYIVRIVFFILI